METSAKTAVSDSFRSFALSALYSSVYVKFAHDPMNDWSPIDKPISCLVNATLVTVQLNVNELFLAINVSDGNPGA